MTAFGVTDEEWVAASLRGERNAFARIVGRYQSLVCSVAYSVTGNVASSEDVAQETFLAAWRTLSQLRDPSRLAPWLCGITRNVARDALRRGQRDPSSRAVPLGVDRESASAERPVGERMDQEEREALVWAALQDVPEAYREPLVLYYREGQSLRAVAELLELSEDAAKQRLSRGRKMLKEKVASLVEETLRVTRPTGTFTAVVVAALSGTTVKASAGLAAGEAAGVGAAASAGKGIATVAGAGLLGGFLGLVGGMAGGLLGTWASIRNAHMLRLRRYILKSAAWWYGVVWLSIGFEGMCDMLAGEDGGWRSFATTMIWAAYVPCLWIGIVVTNRRYARIERREAESGPVGDAELRASALSIRRVYLAGAGGLGLAVVGSAATVGWIHGMTGLGVWVAVVLALCHVAFARLFYWGLRSVPAGNAPVAPVTSVGVDAAHELVTRKRVRSAVGGLMGSVYGSTIWMGSFAALAGFWADALAVAAFATVLVTWGARRMRGRPERVYLTTALVCLVQGIVGFGFGAVRLPTWNAAAGDRLGSVNAWDVCFAFLAISLGLAVAFACMHRLQRKNGTDE